jgi:hypothetical protein
LAPHCPSPAVLVELAEQDAGSNTKAILGLLNVKDQIL